MDRTKINQHVKMCVTFRRCATSHGTCFRTIFHSLGHSHAEGWVHLVISAREVKAGHWACFQHG